MPPRQIAARIDPNVWQSFRTEIHAHYILKDKPLGDLISYMKEKHNFNATKSQYERQLSSWKFRKNLNSDEWEFAIDRMEKRKRDGKENALFVDGFQIPAKRIRKEISRHRRPNNAGASEQVQTPQGISVRTPQAPAALNHSLENLPWIKFQNHIESGASIFGNTSRQDIPNVAQPGSSIQGAEILPIPGTSVSTPVRPASDLPGTPAEQDLVGNIPRIFQLSAAIQDSEGGMTLQRFANQHSLLEVAKSTLFLASNDLLPDDLAQKFLRLVIESKQESVLESLFKEKMPTVEAFQRFTFKHALYIENTKVLRICLQAGADPNLPLKTDSGVLHTPLEVSMYVCGNMELTEVLLDAGAHPNDPFDFTWKRFTRSGLEALAKLFTTELVDRLLNLSEEANVTSCWGGAVLTAAAAGNVEPIRTLFRAGVSVRSIRELGEIAFVAAAGFLDTELVQIFLESGVDINASHDGPISGGFTALEAATVGRGFGDIELVKILLDAGANVNASFEERGTLLQAAAEGGRIELARILLGAGAKVNAPPGEVGTALQAAMGNIELVQILLDAGANPDASFGSEGTLLQIAARVSNIRLVRILLGAGAKVNAPPGEEGTALQAAAARGNLELVQILLDAGANANAPPGEGGTALQAAAEGGNIELVQVLLDAGAKANAPPGERGTALQAAARRGDTELAQILLHAGADVNAPPASVGGKTALQAAAGKGGIELVQILLHAGADVNAPPTGEGGNTALQAAVKEGGIGLVRILLHAGANVNAPPAGEGGNTALQAAVKRGHIELAQILLHAGADVNPPAGKYWKTALQTAVERGDIGLARILLDAGADVNAPPSLAPGRTTQSALHAALGAERNGIELVRILLDAGADINSSAGGDEQRTALQAAVAGGEIELVRVLLDAGADVDALPGSTMTALQEAVTGNRIDLVRLLLDAGADINAPATTYYGRTALQAATASGSMEMVQLLLNGNADVNAPAAQTGGVTALQGAAIKGHLAIAILLLRAGADATAAPAMFIGRSALEGAAENGRLDMVQLLLDASTDTGGPGGKNFSKAVILAERGGHHVVAKLLKDYSN